MNNNLLTADQILDDAKIFGDNEVDLKDTKQQLEKSIRYILEGAEGAEQLRRLNQFLDKD